MCLSGKRSAPPAVGGEADEAASVKFVKPQHKLSSVGLGKKEKEQMEGDGSEEEEEEALVLVGDGETAHREEDDSKPSARITSSPACRC